MAAAAAAAAPSSRHGPAAAAAAAGDEASAAHDTLLLFVRASKENAPAFWDTEFPGVLAATLAQLRDDASGTRDLALKVLRELLRNQTARFTPADARAVVHRLLDCHAEPDRAVVLSVEATLAVAADHLPAAAGVAALCPVVAGEDGGPLLSALKLLAKFVRYLDRNALAPVVPDLAPGLVKGYKHSSAEVRKAVVFALVELQLVLGDELLPYLSALSPSQTKLLAIYVKRAQEKMSVA